MKTGYLVAGLGLLLLGGPVADMFGKGNEQIGSGAVSAASYGLIAMGFGASTKWALVAGAVGGGVGYVGRGLLEESLKKEKT